jgi:ribosomal protein S18 acetylase RimI-like enzyme
VDAATRSSGLGKALVEHAIERARERGCHLVQLTTDKTRPGAKRFYEALGFVATHEGMKRPLTAR